jgi:hypothetical protein
MRTRLQWTVWACVIALTTISAAKIKVGTSYDKTFDFSRVHTYRWHPAGAGEVKLLELSDDDPSAMRARLEPVIVGAVDRALAGRGIAKAATPPSDLHVSYYVLLGANSSAQTVGQFLRPAPEWGVPPFAASTQSLEIYEQGTLILDMAAVAADRVIWRGSAQAKIDRQVSAASRDRRIRAAVDDMLKKFPPKT